MAAKKRTTRKPTRRRMSGVDMPVVAGNMQMAGYRRRRMSGTTSGKKAVNNALYGLAGTVAGIIATEIIVPNLPGTKQTKAIATAALGVGIIVMSKGKNAAIIGMGTGIATSAVIGIIKQSGAMMQLNKVVSGVMMEPVTPAIGMFETDEMQPDAMNAPITMADVDTQLRYGISPTSFGY